MAVTGGPWGEKGHPGCHLGSRWPLLAPVSSAGPFPVCPAHPASIANWALRFHPIFAANGSAAIDLHRGASQWEHRDLWRRRHPCARPSPSRLPPQAPPPHPSRPALTNLALLSPALCPLSSGPSRRKTSIH